MQHDELKNHERYHALARLMPSAMMYLAHTKLDKLVVGRHEIVGDRCFALVQEYTTKLRDQCVWEAHRKFIDVQYVVAGVERMGYAELSKMTMSKPYDEKIEAAFFTGEGQHLDVPAGYFAIFLPSDVHMPGQAAGEPAWVKKVVVKVAVD